MDPKLDFVRNVDAHNVDVDDKVGGMLWKLGEKVNGLFFEVNAIACVLGELNSTKFCTPQSVTCSREHSTEDISSALHSNISSLRAFTFA